MALLSMMYCVRVNQRSGWLGVRENKTYYFVSETCHLPFSHISFGAFVCIIFCWWVRVWKNRACAFFIDEKLRENAHMQLFYHTQIFFISWYIRENHLSGGGGRKAFYMIYYWQCDMMPNMTSLKQIFLLIYWLRLGEHNEKIFHLWW